MTRPTLIFETQKDEDGNYECHSAKEMDPPASGKQSNYWIDSDIDNLKPPHWVVTANELFRQGLQSNVQNGYSDYLADMQTQFEQMRVLLQQQMDRFRGE